MEKISKENRILLFTTIGIILTIIMVLGVTYAYWRLTKEQTRVNVVNSSCLNVTMENQLNDISLKNAFPIIDNEGLKLEPFTFKVKNNCEEYADYTISLEMLNETNLNSDFVKISLNEVGSPVNPKILSSYSNYEDLKLEDTVEGRTITNGKLKPNGEKNYELRIWLDENVKVEDDAMNKIYKSKVVIESTIGKEPPMVQFPGMAIPLADEGEDGLYAIEHNDLEELDDSWNKTEYRYAGVNPDNYVEFNNEKWRIIGLVNVKTESGVEQRIKIIRTNGIEEQKSFGKYAWDRDQGSNPTNNWTTSKLKDMLNGIYYNSGNGECYIRESDDSLLSSQSTCDFSGNGNLPKGLDDTAKQMIDSEVIWNIGGSINDEGVTTDAFYEKERGTSTGSSNTYPAVWTKANDATYHNGIGLMYPSDYGYAVGGNIRKTCLIVSLDSFNYYNCHVNDWLQPLVADNEDYANEDYAMDTWTITPSSSTSSSVFLVYSDGFVLDYTTVSSAIEVWPTIYLTSSTTIYDGDGSINNPFKLSVN